jgi:putative DNA primase/helicase
MTRGRDHENGGARSGRHSAADEVVARAGGAVMTVSPQELLQQHGITYVATRTGKYATKCPKCSSGYLNVKIDRKGATWFCHSCGWDGPKPRKADGSTENSDLGPIKAIYDYTDEAGERLFQVLRFEPLHRPKQFRQRKGPDQKKWAIRGVRIVLFCLHELVKDLAAGRTVFVVEGEKDVLTLRQHGIAATCNPMGAEKWWPEFNETLKGADVVICGDNDEPGREHVMLVAANLHGVARRVRVLNLAKFWPEIQESNDITDWFAAGGTAERLWEMVEQLSPPKDPPACIEPPGASGTQENHSEHANTSTRLLPPPSMPMDVARVFVADHCTHEGTLTLRHWRGGWWRWRSSHWREIPDRGVRSLLYAFTDGTLYLEEGALAPWAPNRRKIGDLFEALAAICILSDDTDQPCWLDDRADSVSVIVAMANGLLDVENRQLLTHTPLYFNQVAVPFDYDPGAPPPKRWHNFLDELWPNEPEAIDVVGEWFGYVISGRTDLHKIFLHVGPTRGGKGIIARIESTLVGRQNVAGPTLNSLAGEFGLAPLIGKSLAVISDARFSGRDSSVVVERLLSISGEDTLTVNRKYRDQWTGKLPTRLHVISNELPKLGDASTAIVGRIVLLLSSRSWLGREDYELEPVLQTELPGILNFALDGLQRLCDNDNRFTYVAAADEAIIQMRDLASPVVAFVREKCELGADKQIDVDVLYAAYKQWAEDNGYEKRSKALFGRDLKAAHPSVRKTRPRGEEPDDRLHVYTGITLRNKERLHER